MRKFFGAACFLVLTAATCLGQTGEVSRVAYEKSAAFADDPPVAYAEADISTEFYGEEDPVAVSDGCGPGCAHPCASCGGRGRSSLFGLSAAPEEQCGIFTQGWLAQGFTWNPDDPANNSNLPVTFNDRANEYQMNQLYLSLERAVDRGGCCWDIGGRVDLLYGTDYFFTTATGLETHQDGSPKWNGGDGPRGAGAALYGLAMPQLYAEVFVPWQNGVSVKLGHFYTILGVESVMAPKNFFYSHSYVKQYGEPFTHTGLLADYTLCDGLDVKAGFTRGWNTWEDAAGTLGFLGGVSWTSCDGCTYVEFALHTGEEDDQGDNRFVYSLVVNKKLPCRLVYVFQHDLGVEENAAVRQDGPADANWYGINQYLLCSVNECTIAGLRVEWFRDEDNARVLGIPVRTQSSGGDYFALTAGLNWRPCRWLRVRPELRWDYSDAKAPIFGQNGVFDDFTSDNQFTAAVDVVINL